MGKLKSYDRIIGVIIIVTVMLSLFPSLIPVSAAADIILTVHYSYETLMASSASEDNFLKDGKVRYMYSPGVSSAASKQKQASEKWYPMYNDTIDLKKYIPKNPNDEYVIAVRLAGESPDSNGLYPSRTTQIIYGRPKINTSDFKNMAVYSPIKNMITISLELKNMGYDYKVGECTWVTGVTDDLYIDPEVNSLGGVVTIRQTANTTTRTFASNECKVKIPKAANMPKIKVNEQTKKLIGIGKNQAWSARADAEFTPILDKNIDLKDIPVKWKTSLDDFRPEIIIKNKAEVECYVIYFKTLADSKKPESPVQKLLIPKSLFAGAQSPAPNQPTSDPISENEP